jgi:hypothetical protein
MLKPYQIDSSDPELLCPDCSSKNIKEDAEVEVKSGKDHNLKQYYCEDCKIHFIPAIRGKINENIQITKWSNKVRQQEGLNESRSWRESDDVCIIIRKKK